MNIFLNYLQLYHTNDNISNGKYSVIFDVTILPSFSHVCHLIKSEIYSIYVLLQKNNTGIVGGGGGGGVNEDTVLATYMFRKSNKMIVNKNANGDKKDLQDIVYMPLSIQMPNTHDNYFICGFINAFKIEKKIEKKGGDIGCIAIDTLSHNKKIIDYLLMSNRPILVEKNTLLFHNYICKTVLPENVLIIN
jgi:hypothetical protein